MNLPKLDEKYRRILRFIDAKPENEILVIGTGVFPKIELFLFNKKCRNITSGDINKKNIDNGKKVLPELKFVFLDAQKKFPFRNKRFDKIVFTEVLEHLKNESFALSEIKRVLRNSGELVLSVPRKRWFNEFFSPITRFQHKREYIEKKIKLLLNKNGFKIENIFVGGCFYELLNLWLHLILKYFFLIVHVDVFFNEKINKTYKKDFKGKGTIIIIRAKKNGLKNVPAK